MRYKREINKLIIKKVIEIIFVMAFIFASIPIWNDVKNSGIAIADGFSDTTFSSLEVKNSLNYAMYPMDDAYAKEHLKATELIVRNDSLTKENYAIELRISKNSTLDYKYLKISVNNEVYEVKNLFSKDTTDESVFTIVNATLSGGIEEYEIKIWINSDASNELQGTNLELSYELVKNAVKI